jgi:dihydrofolate synthase/folylpolyglutamate synthase
VDSGLTGYRAALDALFARTGATSKFGLDRTRRLLALLGNPHDRLKAFHVAGTNGKGSVVITLASLLESKGLRVGRYMSPHLVDFRERIVVNGEPVSEEFILDFLERWGPPAEEMGATFFEITTAMAFHYLASRKVDVAVIETGLGGRLDSTNVITPLVSGITSIGMDHEEFLGGTEEEIAREKAGIFKRGIPAVIGPLSDRARGAVLEIAKACGTQPVIESRRLYPISDVHLSFAGTSFRVDHAGESCTISGGLSGSAQGVNAAVALSMLRAAGGSWAVTLEEASRVLPGVRLPGRFQRVGNCILDVAHNPGGMRSLVSTLAEVDPPGPLVAVLGVLQDKDWREMMTILSTRMDSIILVSPPSAPAERAWDPEGAEGFAMSAGLNARFEPDFGRAISSRADTSGTTVITGSFHTVGDALLVLGVRTL